ncbi:MAG TPA: hypothetical protein VF158_15195 [Longimicrobiales bacterium]
MPDRSRPRSPVAPGAQMSSENGSAAGRRTIIEQAETLLRSLMGVLLARIVADEHGRIREIYAITDDSDAAGQTARNIQSAILARFGILVDIDRISVNATPAPASNGTRPPRPEPTTTVTPGATRNAGRWPECPATAAPPTLDALEIECSHAHRVRCRLSLLWAGHRLDGSAEVIDGPGARAEAAARAAIAALNQAGAAPPLALEGIQSAEIAGRSYATVAIRAFQGRAIRYLAGAAPIEHSAEDAAAAATIQAAGPALDPAPPDTRRSLAAAS